MERKRKKPSLLKEYGRHYDNKLIMIIMVIFCFGLVMIYSSSAYTAALEQKNAMYFVTRQLGIGLGGFILMLIVSRMDYHEILKFRHIIFLISFVCMFLVDFTPLGKVVNGKKRWLKIIPGLQFQPTEMVKIAIIICLTVLMKKMIKRIDKKETIGCIALLTIPITTLVLINNLSSAIIIFGIVVVMYFVASKQKKLFAIAAAALVIIGVLIYNFYSYLPKILHNYQMSRIEIWINPFSDPTGGGYQVLQGLYAIGSGGLLGKGLGNSIQKLGFLPESYNDMVFSVICEELGLFGATCVILLFAYMIYRFVYIATYALDLEGSLLVTGVMAHIAIQVILNIGVVTNTIPNTGVTLPFISYGGTSILFLMMEMGLVLSVSNQIIYQK